MKLAPRALGWRRPLLLLVVCGLTALGVGPYFVAGALVAPAPQAVRPPSGDLPIESVEFDSDSGSRIAGWLVDNPGASATVVLLHPLRSNRRAMLGRARVLWEAGYRVLLIDLQAHGESRGEAITMGWLERHDATAAVDFVLQRWPEEPVGVVGWSLGGAAALLASPLGVEALVLESVYSTLSEAVHNRLARRVGPLAPGISPLLLWQVPFRLGVGTGALRPIDKMGQAGCRVLLLAGDQDRRTTPSESERMAAAGGAAADLVLFPGAGHVDLLDHDRERWLDAVLPYLRSALGPKSPSQMADGSPEGAGG